MNISSCCGCCSVQTGVFGIGVFNMLIALLLYIRVQLDPLGVWYMHLTPTVYLVSGILLVFGVKHGLSEFVFPSICIYFTSIVLLIPMQFIQQFSFAILTTELTPIVMTIVMGIAFALCFYFFMVINTFYEELLREKYAVVKADNHLIQVYNLPYDYHI